jgi:integrase
VLNLIVQLALSTGMRYSEVMKLTKADVDCDSGVITLGETKNGEVRSIPLDDHQLELFKDHCQTITADHALLFPSPNNPKKPIDIRSAWENVVRDANILNFRFHDLRHTTASYLAIEEHSLLDIATLLGHKDLQMTKRYAHLSQEYKKKMVSTMMSKILSK